MTIVTDVSLYEVLLQSANVSPIELSQGELMEAHKGCLVSYDYLKCIETNNVSGEATLESSLGYQITISDYLYQYPFVLNAEVLVQGVVIEENGIYKLCPRDPSDVISLVSLTELNQNIFVNVKDNILYVKSSSSDQKNYELYNILGEQIITGTFTGELSLSLESYSVASYILRLDRSYYRIIKN